MKMLFRANCSGVKGAKHHKAPGEDLIPYEMLQNLHKSAMKVLLRIYNGIWDGGAMPGDWKHAIILPLPKASKDLSVPGSYRPISLTSTLCKVMEKMVTNRLQWFVEGRGLLTKDQTGFRQNSTIDQIIRLQDQITKRINHREHVLGIFIDFEKAYDMLHVPTLLRKIHHLGSGREDVRLGEGFPHRHNIPGEGGGSPVSTLPSRKWH